MATHASRFRKRGRPVSLRETIDKGTPELIRKKNAGLTAEIIDLLHARGVITESQHRSALHFRWLYCLRHGVPTVSALNLAGHVSSIACEKDPQWHAEKEREYREAAQLLHKNRLLTAVLKTAVFNDRVFSSDGANRANIQAGMEMLEALWSGNGSSSEFGIRVNHRWKTLL